MHLRFFRALFAAEDGGAGGGGDAGQAGDAPAASADSLLAAASAETPPAGDGAAAGKAAGEPGSPEGQDNGDGKGAGKDGDTAEGAPEAYADFTLPDGVTANEQALGDFKTLAKELNLSQGGAQKLVDLYSKQAAEAAQAPYRLWQDTQTKWVGEIKADPEIGGANLGANMAAAAKAIDAFGGAALREALNFTGAGNNPAIVKAFVQIGKSLAEDGFIHGNPIQQSKTLAEKFYPTTKET